MAPRLPLKQLALGSASLADDLIFVALADLHRVLAARPDTPTRLIGGIMVSLHAGRWGLGAEFYRQTRDADLGIPTSVAKDPWVVLGLEDAGYRRAAGNRFVRTVEDIQATIESESGASLAGQYEAAIDILVPAYRSRARDNVRIGEHLTTTEVRGLAYAFNHPAIPLDLEMARLNGEVLGATVALPDEASTVVLRSFAWHVRGADTDAVDLWRSLEIAHAAAIGPQRFSKAEAPEAAAIARRAFSESGGALKRIGEARGLSTEAAVRLNTRIRALIQEVLGNEN
jgi:hypothetical protein